MGTDQQLTEVSQSAEAGMKLKTPKFGNQIINHGLTSKKDEKLIVKKDQIIRM
jgi:hypothetical protein